MTSKRSYGQGSVFHDRARDRYGCAIMATLPDGSRRQVTTWHASRKEAEQAQVRRLGDIARGAAVAPDRQTVQQFLAVWLADVVAPTAKARTLERYSREVRLRINPSIGHQRLQRLTPQHVQRWLATVRASGLAPASVVLAFAVLHSALDRAVRWEMLARNPADRVDRPTAPQPRVEPYSVDQARALLMAIGDHRNAALYRVALSLGLRLGELAGLRWSDLDLDGARPSLTIEQQTYRVNISPGVTQLVTDTPKSDASARRIRLPAPLVAALLAHRDRQTTTRRLAGARWQEQGLVFPTSIGTPFEPRNINRQFHLFRVKAGLPHRRPHDLRHSAATFMLAEGVPLKTIQTILGHATFTLTADTYSHLTDGMEDAAADRIGTVLARIDNPAATAPGSSRGSKREGAGGSGGRVRTIRPINKRQPDEARRVRHGERPIS